jgi:hypothetical protein
MPARYPIQCERCQRQHVIFIPEPFFQLRRMEFTCPNTQEIGTFYVPRGTLTLVDQRNLPSDAIIARDYFEPRPPGA